jgi:hypothetical protein
VRTGTPIHVGQERTWVDDEGKRRVVTIEYVLANGDVKFSTRVDGHHRLRSLSADLAAERLLSKADLAALARDDSLVRFRDAGDRFVAVERLAPEAARREVSLAQLSSIEGALRAALDGSPSAQQRVRDALALIDGVRRGVR